MSVDLVHEIERLNGLISEARQALADGTPVDLSPLTGMVRALCDEILRQPEKDRTAAKAGIESVVAALDGLALQLEDWKTAHTARLADAHQLRAYAKAKDRD